VGELEGGGVGRMVVGWDGKRMRRGGASSEAAGETSHRIGLRRNWDLRECVVEEKRRDDDTTKASLKLRRADLGSAIHCSTKEDQLRSSEIMEYTGLCDRIQDEFWESIEWKRV